MKLGSLLLLSALLVNSAYAGHGRDRAQAPAVFTVDARVLEVEPLVRTVQVSVPQEVCWEEPVQRSAHQYDSATPKVLGGILGGVAGNQFGGGSGNKIMTVAGALLGASIGRDVAYKRRQHQNQAVAYERVCEIEQVIHEEERADGYRVTYEYGGQEFVTYRDEAPGDYIRVRVQLRPVAYNSKGPKARSARHADFKHHG